MKSLLKIIKDQNKRQQAADDKFYQWILSTRIGRAIGAVTFIPFMIFFYFLLPTFLYFFILNLFGWVNLFTIILYMIIIGSFITTFLSKDNPRYY